MTDVNIECRKNLSTSVYNNCNCQTNSEPEIFLFKSRFLNVNSKYLSGI
jgi:hypothetical protein